jgi:hypothetical protein
MVVEPPEFLVHFDRFSDRWRSRSDDQLDPRAAADRRFERWYFARKTWCSDNGWTVEQLTDLARSGRARSSLPGVEAADRTLDDTDRGPERAE